MFTVNLNVIIVLLIGVWCAKLTSWH